MTQSQYPPIVLSGVHRKAMDRWGGAELILSWPADLPRGPLLAPDEERDATPAEHAIAVRIVGAACAAADLVPVHSTVGCLRRPHNLPGGGVWDDHLIVLIVGARWAQASMRHAGIVRRRFWYRGVI